MGKSKKTGKKQKLAQRIMAIMLTVCMLATSSGRQVISAETQTELPVRETAAESGPALGAEKQKGAEAKAAQKAEEQKAAAEAEAAQKAEEQKAAAEAEAAQKAEEQKEAEAEAAQKAEEQKEAEAGAAQKAEEQTAAEAETEQNAARQPETETGAEAASETVPETEREPVTETGGETEEIPETGTEAQTETEPEAGTEGETEPKSETAKAPEESKTEFLYQDSRVVIRATASEEANFPPNTQLRADYLEPGSEKYQAAVGEIEAVFGGSTEKVQKEYVLYDIYFLADGVRIEPEDGKVKVTMDFVVPVLGENEGEIISQEVIHVPGQGAPEKVTDYVKADEEGAVSSVGFTADSFSPVALVESRAVESEVVESRGVESRTEERAGEAEGESSGREISLDSHIVSADMNILIKGTEYTLAEIEAMLGAGTLTGVPEGSPVNVTIHYGEISDLNPEDILTFQIPNAITIVQEQTMDVKDGDATVGTATIHADGSVAVTLSETYLRENDNKIKGGTITFRGSFSSAWGSGEQKVIQFGNAAVTLPANWVWSEPKEDISISKMMEKYPGEENWDGKSWKYTVTVTASEENDQKAENVRVEDTFTSGGNYIRYASSDREVSQGWIERMEDGGEDAKASAVWQVGDLEPGQTATLSYRVEMRDGYTIHNLTEGLANQAEVYAGDVQKDTDLVSEIFDGTLHIEKSSGEKFVFGEDGIPRVTYTITVTAPATNTYSLNNVTVEDAFSTGKEDLTSYTKITDTKTDKAGQISTETGNVTADAATGTLNWAIGSMEPGEKRELTYTVELKKDLLMGEESKNQSGAEAGLYNWARVKVNGEPWGSSSANVYEYKNWVWKDGHPYPNGDSAGNHKGEIQFDVGVNGQRPNTGQIGLITDQLYGDYVYTGNLEIMIYPYMANGEIDWEHRSEHISEDIIDGKTDWKYQVPVPYNNGSYYIYLKYFAKPKPGREEYPLSNSVTVVIGDEVNTYDHTVSWGGSMQGKSSVKKEYTGGAELGTASWKSTIPCPVSENGFYCDWLSDKWEQWFTEEQIRQIRVEGVPEGSYTITTDNPENGESSSEGHEGKYRAFWVVFNQAITGITEENPITITYSTTLKTDTLKNGETKSYENNAELHIGKGMVTSKADCSYTQKTSVEKTAGLYDPVKKELTWYIDVNHREGSNMEGTAVIEDTLPPYMTFQSAAVTSGPGTVTADPASDGQKVTLQISGLERGTGTRIEVVTVLSDPILDSEEFEKTYQNTAVMTYHDEQITVRAEKLLIKKKITKESLYDYTTWPYIDYTVVVNPDGEDLLEGNTTVTVIDEMSPQMELAADSLTVAYDGVPTTDYVFRNVPKEHRFELDVRDDVAVTVKYRVAFNVPAGERVWAVNAVTYSGETGILEEDSREVLVHDAAATVGVNGNFKLKKTDSESGAVLAGAKFIVKEVTGFDDQGKPILAEEGQEQETGAAGTLTFTDLDKDKLYCYYETEAPVGYKTDSTRYYVAFKNLSTIPAGSTIQVSMIQSGREFSVTNEPVKGTIKITKRVTGPAPSADTFHVALYRDAAGTERVANQEVKSVQKDQTAVFENLELGTYYVFETTETGEKLTGYQNGYRLPGGGSAVTVTAEHSVETAEIQNEYVGVSYALPVQKLVRGISAGTSTKTFDFELTVEDRTAANFGFADSAYQQSLTKGEVRKLTGVGAGETKSFAPLYYNTAGTYTYLLKESADKKYDGYTNDSREYRITVKVEMTDGRLAVSSVKREQITAGGNAADSAAEIGTDTAVTFINQYYASGSLLLKGTKRLLGGRKTLLADDEFTFRVTENGREAAIGKSKADGSIEFTEIPYTLQDIGTHVYEIREVRGTDGNLTYSDAVLTVTVEVTDSGNGVLDARASYPAGGIVFENQYVQKQKAAVEVTKRLVYGGAGLIAADQTFYVALYSDEACTRLATDIRPLVFKNASSSTVEFSDLEPGRTYYVGECDAAGNAILSGVISTGDLFAVNFAQGRQSVVTEADQTVKFTFENEFFQIPDLGFYKEGELTITKNLLDADGSAAESDEVFYAGIFADAAHTIPSDRVSASVVPLDLSGGSSVSETVTVSIKPGESVTLYVTEVDEDGVPVEQSSGFAYEVSMDQTEVTLDESSPFAGVTITNQEAAEEEESETEITTETEKETEKKEEKPKSVRTGDDTPVAAWLMIWLISLCGMLLLLFAKRRGNKEMK